METIEKQRQREIYEFYEEIEYHVKDRYNLSEKN